MIDTSVMTPEHAASAVLAWVREALQTTAPVIHPGDLEAISRPPLGRARLRRPLESAHDGSRHLSGYLEQRRRSDVGVDERLLLVGRSDSPIGEI